MIWPMFCRGKGQGVTIEAKKLTIGVFGLVALGVLGFAADISGVTGYSLRDLFGKDNSSNDGESSAKPPTGDEVGRDETEKGVPAGTDTERQPDSKPSTPATSEPVRPDPEPEPTVASTPTATPTPVARPVPVPQAPPIGLASLICASGSIEVFVPLDAVAGSGREMRKIAGAHTVSVTACDEARGTFQVAARQGLGERPPSTGSAKAYSLSFTYIAGTRNGLAYTDVVCRVSGRSIVTRTFIGEAVCVLDRHTYTFPVEISL